MYKKCPRCKENLPIGEFGKRLSRGKPTTQAYCKQCNVTYHKNRHVVKSQEYLEKNRAWRNAARKRNRQLLYTYLEEHSCPCGEKDPAVLEFDHIDPSTKEGHVSDLVSKGWSWDRIMVEIERCQVLCANCHKRKTAKQFGWYR